MKTILCLGNFDAIASSADPSADPGDEKLVLRFASAIASEDPGPSTAGALTK